MTLVWSRSAIGEKVHAYGGVTRSQKLPVETDFSPNSQLYKVLKLPHDSHAVLVFHWLRITPMQCLFFIDHGLHPQDVCFGAPRVV